MFSKSWCSFGGGIFDKAIFTKETSSKFIISKVICKSKVSWKLSYKSYSRSGILCGGVGVKDSPSFKTLVLSLLSGNLDKFNTFVEIGSKLCDVGRGSFFWCICC